MAHGVGLLAVLAVLASPAVARAEVTVHDDGSYVRVVSDGPEDLTVAQVGDQVQIREASDAAIDADGCTLVDPSTVACAANGVGYVDVDYEGVYAGPSRFDSSGLPAAIATKLLMQGPSNHVRTGPAPDTIVLNAGGGTTVDSGGGGDDINAQDGDGGDEVHCGTPARAILLDRGDTADASCYPAAGQPAPTTDPSATPPAPAPTPAQPAPAPVPPAGPAPPAAQTQPVAEVVGRPTLRGRRLSLRLRCGSVICSGRLRMTLGGRQVAARGVALAAGRSAAVTLVLGPTALRRLHHGAALKLSLAHRTVFSGRPADA